MIIHETAKQMLSKRKILGQKRIKVFNQPTPNSKNMVKVNSYAIAFKRIEALSTEDNPCSESPERELAKCLESHFLKRLRCRVPWMKPEKAESQLPSCSSQAEFDQWKNETLSLASLGQSRLFELLNCSVPCHRIEFDIQESIDGFIDCSYLAGLVDGDNCTGISFVHFKVLDGIVRVEKETLLYDGTNFIADIGGYLGLLLGVSAITCLEWGKILGNYIADRKFVA